MTPRNRTLTVIAAVAVVLSSAAVLYATGEESSDTTGQTSPPAPAVTVAPPTVRNIVEWDEYTGRFEAIDYVEVRARVSGYLTDVAFNDGDIVEAGALLFRIDARPFEAELAAARAALASATAQYESAKAEAERGQRLLDRRALSEEDADRRTRALRQAEADRAAARSAVTQAELNVEFTEVRAPVAGRVSDNFVSVGNLIVGGAQGGTLLTTVVSLDPIYFEFTASEADYLKYLRLAQEGSRTSGRDRQHPVRVRLMDEDDFSHDGKLTFVDNQIDRSTGTMRGRATLDNPDLVFSPGMFGRMQLIASGEYEAIMIPDTAVQTDQAQKFVWIATAEDTAERREVELGPIIDGLRIVRQGLAPGDRVMVAGTQFVRPGAEVTIQRAQPGGGAPAGAAPR